MGVRGRHERSVSDPARSRLDRQWDDKAAATHGISRDELAVATPRKEVVRVMFEQLPAHDLLAGAPSWDGKGLSAQLRGAGYPRHMLRLRDSDDALREVADHILAPNAPPEKLQKEVAAFFALAEVRPTNGPRAHRALADARAERDRWCTVWGAARATEFSRDVR